MVMVLHRHHFLHHDQVVLVSMNEIQLVLMGLKMFRLSKLIGKRIALIMT
jgi:hypothetical protein